MKQQSLTTADLISYGHGLLENWESSWPAFDTDETLQLSGERQIAVVTQLAERLQENYPFFHPSYAGQMLKPPHQIAAAAYAIAQRINPNNHALDGGPATAKMELEVVQALAAMFGLAPAETVGHLTSSGTIANLEALWVARQHHPGKNIAYSTHAHYTHGRMCEVLGVTGVAIPVDQSGQMDLDALAQCLAEGQVGTVVATAGTTGLGAVDQIDQIQAMAAVAGVRVHVDTAYGGFFTLLADDNDTANGTEGQLSAAAAAAFRAIGKCDSVVIDPHKCGLQPYGCGAVLFRDPQTARFYLHDSPYTYFTSNERHLGEISLECSRAGAAAAAFWATLQCFPLAADAGFGLVLRKTRSAAQRWSQLIAAEPRLRLVVEPALDIVNFYLAPTGSDWRVSTISAVSNAIFHDLMDAADDPLYLALYALEPDIAPAGAALDWDAPSMTVLRSVLMKPEHFDEIPGMHERVLRSLHAVEMR